MPDRSGPPISKKKNQKKANSNKNKEDTPASPHIPLPSKPWTPMPHTCFGCRKKTSDPSFARTCLYNHSFPCARFHNTLFGHSSASENCCSCKMEDACAERREADIKALEKSIERENLGLMDGFAKPRKKEIAKLVKTLEEMRKEDKMKRTNTSNEFNVRKSGFFEWKSGGP